MTGPRWAQPRPFAIAAGALNERGAWIGRAPDCAVALDDPDRFVSLYHCRLHGANGGIWVTDQSTNGTVIVGAGGSGQTRLAKGETYRLASGDTLRVGMFEAAVRLGGEAAGFADTASALDDLNAGAPLVPRDPLAAFLESPTPEPARDAPALADFAPPPAHRGGDPFDSLLAEFATDREPLARFPAAPAQAAAPPPPPPQPQPVPPPDMAMQAPASDMLGVITSEVADSAPAIRSSQMVAEAGRAQRDTATMALAAFWCGLGIIPRSLQPEELVEVMAELGVAFREATDGLAGMARGQRTDRPDEANPFANGHSGLRRSLEARGEARMSLDEAVRAIFARVAERDARREAATRAGVQAMGRSLSASAIEQRIGVAVATRRPRARRAELWRMFALMQDDLIALAELRFRKEVEETLRRAERRPGEAAGGPDL